MKLQSRSFVPNRLFGRRSRANVASAGDIDVTDIPVTNMQSLAAELQQSAQQGEFQYPNNWVLVTKTVAALLVILSVSHAAAVLMALLTYRGSSLGVLLSWTTLGLALGVAGAGLIAGFLVNLFPVIQVTPQGLGVKELTGWRCIPWKQVSVLRVMELRNSKASDSNRSSPPRTQQ